MQKILPPRHPARKPGEPWTAQTLAAELIWRDWSDQPYEIVQERRLVALEEALVSRKARRRLRRQLRDSVSLFSWASDSFYGRRIEAVGNTVLCWHDENGSAE